MNLEDFEKVDSRKMFQIYDKWPEIAQESFSTDFNKFDSKGIDHIVCINSLNSFTDKK